MIVGGLLVLVVLSITSIIPDVLRFPDKYNLRWHAHAFLETTFDLANTAEANLQGYGWGRRASNLIDAGLIKGTYPARIDELSIDIKFKHWSKVNRDRDRALHIGALRKATWVPATINFQGQAIKTELRLKGTGSEHWYLPKRWSFRVKLKNGASIKDFTQFSLQRPAARQFPFDQLFQHWRKINGGLSPEYRTVRVHVNGDYWGIMQMEEHVSRTMVELNGYKESPIFQLATQTSSHPELYSAAKYSGDDRILRLYSYVLSQFKYLKRKGIRVKTLLDQEAFAKSLITATAWGSRHTLNLANSRMYLNPYTLLVEPINTDQARYARIPEKQQIKTNANDIFSLASQSDNFESILPNVLQDLENTLPNLSDKYRDLCEYFPLDCPNFDPDVLRENIKWVRNVAKPAWLSQDRNQQQYDDELSPVDLASPGPSSSNDPRDDTGVKYPEHILAEHYDDGILRIYNLLTRPVKVTQIVISCTKQAKPACRPRTLPYDDHILESSTESSQLHFRTWDTHVRDLGRERNIEITTERNGQTIETIIPFTLRSDIENPLLTNRNKISDTQIPDWITYNDNSAYVAPGTWSVNSPVILPIGMNLHIAAGTTLNFSNDAYMIVRGAFIAKGDKDKPVILAPINQSWKGIYILEAKEQSVLSHVQMLGTNFLVDGVLDLTGGMTFYRSNVKITNSVFRGSLAEDALNIVHSEFTISNTDFSDNRSDAFDSDFSNGTIRTSSFRNIGGDAVDLSGSSIDVHDLMMSNIRDKAISVGEKSTLIAFNIKVSNSGSAIVSKDGSNSVVDGLIVERSKGLAAMAYVKKSVYGTASLDISNSNLHPDDILNQTGNLVSLDGLEISSASINVDELYVSEQMKK